MRAIPCTCLMLACAVASNCLRQDVCFKIASNGSCVQQTLPVFCWQFSPNLVEPYVCCGVLSCSAGAIQVRWISDADKDDHDGDTGRYSLLKVSASAIVSRRALLPHRQLLSSERRRTAQGNGHWGLCSSVVFSRGSQHGCQLIFGAHCQTYHNLLPNCCQKCQLIVPVKTLRNRFSTAVESQMM